MQKRVIDQSQKIFMAVIATNSIETVAGNKHNENVKKKLTTKGTVEPG